MTCMRSSISFGFIGLPNDAPAIIANISTFSHLRFMDTPSGPDVESPESASECTSPLRVQSCVRQGRRTAAADGFTVLEEVAAKKQEAIYALLGMILLVQVGRCSNSQNRNQKAQ